MQRQKNKGGGGGGCPRHPPDLQRINEPFSLGHHSESRPEVIPRPSEKHEPTNLLTDFSKNSPSFNDQTSNLNP